MEQQLTSNNSTSHFCAGIINNFSLQFCVLLQDTLVATFLFLCMKNRQYDVFRFKEVTEQLKVVLATKFNQDTATGFFFFFTFPPHKPNILRCNCVFSFLNS